MMKYVIMDKCGNLYSGSKDNFYLNKSVVYNSYSNASNAKKILESNYPKLKDKLEICQIKRMGE